MVFREQTQEMILNVDIRGEGIEPGTYPQLAAILAEIDRKEQLQYLIFQVGLIEEIVTLRQRAEFEIQFPQQQTDFLQG